MKSIVKLFSIIYDFRGRIVGINKYFVGYCSGFKIYIIFSDDGEEVGGFWCYCLINFKNCR